MPQNFGPFYTTFTQSTDFLFGSNLVPPPKTLNNKFQIFFIQSLLSRTHIKSFELKLYTVIQTDVHTQITTFTYLPPNPKYLLILKTGQL